MTITALTVVAASAGLNARVSEPFKREGDKIYIPPHTHVRFELQRKAAYQGLDDKEMYNYCNGLYKIVKSVIPKEKDSFLDPIRKMLSEKKTVSDRLMAEAKKIGVDIKKGPTNAQAAELAMKWSRDLFKDVIMTKKALHALNGQ